MAGEFRFDGKVAIVTGAGNGLGRAHALLLASRGAKIVVNDLGGGAKGEGKGSEAADKVASAIKAAGGEAVANFESVEDGGKIVQCALDSFGRIDIVVNNAGILRDGSFQKMSDEDWELIYRVHVLGSYRVTRAAWNHLRDQGYGRVIFTASAAGIYGNFGQANYGMAKLGLLGFSNTLAIEGKKKNVLVNTIAPIAASRLTEGILPKEAMDALQPECVSPLVAYLCHDSCDETGGLYEVGGGFFSKLRWERAEGHTFRRGRAITLEALDRVWGKVTNFEKSTHPTDVMQSMQPILANTQAPVSKGGNEFIDADEALGFENEPMTSSYEERDLALYALSVGAARDPLNEKELAYVYELNSAGFRPLPTYAVVPAVNLIMTLAKEGKLGPGLNFGLDRILHGEQYTEVLRPLPPKAKLTHKARVKDIFDKGKLALLVTEIRSYDESGEELVRNEVTTAIRGAGGWGGDRGPVTDLPVPERAPDKVVEEKIPDNQALFYRLSGDWNPMHVDPAISTAFGFKKPLLHGLCTFGYAGRNVITNFAPKDDSRHFKAIKVRFAEAVFPGETLVTEMWKESATRVLFRCKVKERDKVVISNAFVEFYAEIPKAKQKPTNDGAAPTGAKASGPSSTDIFAAIGNYVAKNPDLAQKVGVVFEFRVKDPDRTWTLDLKNGGGSVAEGSSGKAECTLEISDADFLSMTIGGADAQKLYFGGKLKISGNVMASQKLEFLKKIRAEDVKDAGTKAKTSAQARAAAPQGSAQPTAPALFEKLKETFQKSPPLAKEFTGVANFFVKNPDARWVIDGIKGEIRSGEEKTAAATFTIDDADLALLASGAESPKSLHQKGKLRVDGDVRLAHKLSILKG